MADHERGEVVAWLCTPTTIGFGAHEVVGSPEERDHYAGYRHTIEPLVRQSDYLEAVAEIERLKAALLDDVKAKTMLTEMAVRNGGLNVGLEGGACQLLADCFADQFIKSGAVNYLELSFASHALMPGEGLVVTMQKVSGKTPHMLRAEAEAERDELRARIEAAPVGELVASHAHAGDFALDAGQGVPVDILALAGKRVRLVVDEAGEEG